MRSETFLTALVSGCMAILISLGVYATLTAAGQPTIHALTELKE